MDNKKKFWCAFSRLTKTSSAFVNKLYSHFGDIEYAWNANEVELKQVEGVLKSSVSAFINERKTVTPEECLEFLNDDELLEVTPLNLRIRKIILDHTQRGRADFRKKNNIDCE